VAEWLVRLELSNFNQNVFNTQDLSTIRGASMAADAGAHYIACLIEQWCIAGQIDMTLADGAGAIEALSGPLGCEHLFAGSSEAELKLPNASREDVAKLCAAARQRLRDSDGFRAPEPYYRKRSYEASVDRSQVPPTEHLTFSLDFEEIVGGDEAGARSRLAGEPGSPGKLDRRAGREPSVTWLEPVDLNTDPDLKALAPERRRPSARCPIDPMRVVGSADRDRGAWILARPGQIPDPSGGEAIRVPISDTTEQARVSQRVSDLRNFGRTARRDLYTRQLADRWAELNDQGFLGEGSASFDLVQSFQDMVAQPPQSLRPSPRNKIAIVYFDGNGWGDLIKCFATRGRTKCFTAAAEKTFAEIYATLLRRFIEGARGPQYKSDPNDTAQHPHTAYSLFDCVHVPKLEKVGPDKGKDTGKMELRNLLRLETLMIGGEDMVIACPSWLAFEVVQTVFDVVAAREKDLHKTMAYWPGKEEGKPRHFSMRAGVVIADKGMPIRRAKDLALGLNESLKDWDSDKNKRKKNTVFENMVQFHILESLDVPDRGNANASIVAERARLFREDQTVGFSQKDFHIRGGDLAELRANLNVLRHPDVLPRSQLYRWLRMARNRESRDAIQAAMEERLKSPDYRLCANELIAKLPGPADACLIFRLKLLAEYWDYAWPFDTPELPESKTATAPAGA